MKALNADEVALETETSNKAALKLYERLGFLRSKRLHRYYFNGNSAFRLILYLKEAPNGGCCGEEGEHHHQHGEEREGERESDEDVV
jgi:peptide alpha-N-acetyltransferase